MTTQTNGKRWKAIAGAAFAALLVAGVGGTLTDISPWYLGLRQPSWKPPNWAFGPIWTLVLSLWAVAGYLSWRAAPGNRARAEIIGFFSLNGLLNIVWSWLFFRFQRPDWALVEAGLLWLSIAILIWITSKLDRRASLLLVPYLIWVTAAFALNLQVVQLNPVAS